MIPLTDDFQLDMNRLDEVLNDRTKIVAVTAMSNVTGTINPIKELARRGCSLCELGIPYSDPIADGPVIPQSIIERPPTAELREDQFDTDSLPPYDVLDPILQAYVEEDRSLKEIVELGYDEKLVARVIRTVDLNEYKRRQSPPGVKITPRAFGRDRRLPITNRCREY